MESSNRSARIRDYSVALLCVVFVVLGIVFFSKIFLLMGSGGTLINTRAVCGNDSVYVFIGANEDLRDVRCVALDEGFFDSPEIVLGDLSLNDEDVCRFRLLRNTTEPLRFEVWYNNRVKREVCEWQHYPRYVD